MINNRAMVWKRINPLFIREIMNKVKKMVEESTNGKIILSMMVCG